MIRKIFSILFAVIGSILTTAVALMLVVFGFDVFAGYGITLSIALHVMSVVVIMAFMGYVIYTSWTQTWTAIKTGEFT